MRKTEVWIETELSERAISGQLAGSSFPKPVFIDVRNRTRIESKVLAWIQQCIANLDNDITPPGRAVFLETRCMKPPLCAID